MRAPELKVYLDDLVERNKSNRESLDKLDREHKQTLQLLNDTRRELEKEIDRLNRELDDLKKWRDDLKITRAENARRLWAFGPNIAGPVVTAFLSIIISSTTILIVTYFKTPTP